LTPYLPAHLAVGDGEEQVVSAGERAIGECDTHRARAIVRSLSHPFDVIQAHALLCARTGDLENGKVAGDTSTQVALVSRSGGDVIGHHDDPYVGSFGAHPVGCLTEVQHVTGVVAEAEGYATTSVRSLKY